MKKFCGLKCGKSQLFVILFVTTTLTLEASGLFVYSSCHRNTKWEKCNGAPIRSFLKSIVHSTRPNTVNPRLTALFDSNSVVSIALGNQCKTKGWRKFGTKEFDGWLYGYFDNIKDMTGDNLTFVYDDYKTVLYGTWLDGNMVKSRKAVIKGYRCNKGLMELQTTKTHPKDQTYIYEAKDINFITSFPKVMDPFDHATLFIKNSNIPVVVGDGLFAKRNIPQGSLVAYYAGAHLYNYSSIIFPNMTLDEREDCHKNILSFNDDYDLDCPGDLTEYRAALGHKGNHAFNANVKFCFVKSPRFGETRCLEAIADVNKGDEIYIDYRYNLESSYVPRWYKTLYYNTYPEEKTTTATAANTPKVTTTTESVM